MGALCAPRSHTYHLDGAHSAPYGRLAVAGLAVRSDQASSI
jgi:hypothetical protein